MKKIVTTWLLAGLMFPAGFAQGFSTGDSPPLYSGGDRALQKFISENLVIPESAKAGGISGTVMITCRINKNSGVDQVQVLRGLSTDCDAEAVRVAGLMNGWNAAVRQGMLVDTYVVIPVEFRYGPIVTRRVSGMVAEKNTGLPIAGAMVIIKGTHSGTVTDKDGFYTLDVPAESNDLLYMAIGFAEHEESIDGATFIRALMDIRYYRAGFPGE